MKWCALFIIVPDYIISFIIYIAFLNRINVEKLTSENKVTLVRYNCPAFIGQKWYNQALSLVNHSLLMHAHLWLDSCWEKSENLKNEDVSPEKIKQKLIEKLTKQLFILVGTQTPRSATAWRRCMKCQLDSSGMKWSHYTRPISRDHLLEMGPCLTRHHL